MEVNNMDKFDTTCMMRLEGVQLSNLILDKIKNPVRVTVADASLYAEHTTADQILTTIANNNSLDSLIATNTTAYNSLNTRTQKHMCKALKNPIRLDTLLEDGYKYLVVRTPEYITRYPFNDYKYDIRNLNERSAKNVFLWMCGIDNNGKPDYTRTNPILDSDPYFGNLSFSSLNPFNVVYHTSFIRSEDCGAKAGTTSKFDLTYLHKGIDLDYAVNKLDCVMLSIATIGYSGQFYYNANDKNAGLLSEYSSNAVQNISYYYM